MENDPHFEEKYRVVRQILIKSGRLAEVLQKQNLVDPEEDEEVDAGNRIQNGHAARISKD